MQIKGVTAEIKSFADKRGLELFHNSPSTEMLEHMPMIRETIGLTTPERGGEIVTNSVNAPFWFLGGGSGDGSTNENLDSPLTKGQKHAWGRTGQVMVAGIVALADWMALSIFSGQFVSGLYAAGTAFPTFSSLVHGAAWAAFYTGLGTALHGFIIVSGLGLLTAYTLYKTYRKFVPKRSKAE